MEANGIMATKARNSNSRIRAIASQSGVSESEIRDNIADIRREILEEISREEEPGNFWIPQHPARVQSPPIFAAIRFSLLRQEILNVEESASNGTNTRHYEITPRGNALRYQHSWVQELAMQNIMFSSLLVVNPENNHVRSSNT
jgi:hypothetical protein